MPSYSKDRSNFFFDEKIRNMNDHHNINQIYFNAGKPGKPILAVAFYEDVKSYDSMIVGFYDRYALI